MVEKEVTHLESSDSVQSEPEDEEQDMSADELESLVKSMKQVKVSIQPVGLGPPLLPMAPGPPPPFAVPGTSFHPECWREVAAQNPALCFPVFQNQQDNNRYHEPLDFKIIKNPLSDFVARMVEAAGKVFGDPDTAMLLVKQLVFEQCTKECRQAINPYKNKGFEVWMKGALKV